MTKYYDSTVVGGTGDGSSFANARTTLTDMTGVAANEIIYVADTHAETAAAALTITFPGTPINPNLVICVDKSTAGSLDGTTWRSTATVTTTGAFGITIGGSAYVYGITFNVGTGAVAAALNLGVNAGSAWQYFETCAFYLATTGTSTSSRIALGTLGSSRVCRITWNDVTVILGNPAQNIAPQQCHFEWRNTETPFGGFAPNTMFLTMAMPWTFLCEGVNFNLMTTGKTYFVVGGNSHTEFHAVFSGCRIPATGTITGAMTSTRGEIYLCNSGPNVGAPGQVSSEAKYVFEGTEVTSYVMARVDGAADSVRSYSRGYYPTVNALPFRPYSGLPFVKWNTTTAADLTITLYGLLDGAALPSNNAAWFEVQYYGDALTTLITLDHCGVKPNFMAAGTTWEADTSDWTAGTVAERANSTSYAQFAAIKLASNPGRVFIKTNAGSHSTAASEPAGYATAVDGDTFTDGTAFFRAAFRFKLTMTISSPQVAQAGPIYVVPKLANMTGTVPILWLDPILG